MKKNEVGPPAVGDFFLTSSNFEPKNTCKSDPQYAVFVGAAILGSRTGVSKKVDFFTPLFLRNQETDHFFSIRDHFFPDPPFFSLSDPPPHPENHSPVQIFRKSMLDRISEPFLMDRNPRTFRAIPSFRAGRRYGMARIHAVGPWRPPGYRTEESELQCPCRLFRSTHAIEPSTARLLSSPVCVPRF